MRMLRAMSMAQRVVVVVGLGLLLLIGWLWWYAGVLHGGGWFAYAPNTELGLTDDYFMVRHRQWQDVAVPVALVLAWTAVSVSLLGLKPREDRAAAT